MPVRPGSAVSNVGGTWSSTGEVWGTVDEVSFVDTTITVRGDMRGRTSWSGLGLNWTLSLSLLAAASAPAQMPASGTVAPAKTPGQTETACVKQVLGLYCLGSDINLVLRQRPPTSQERNGDHLALIYDQGSEQDYVLAYQGTVYKVVRQFRVETQLKFQEIYSQLREKYGPGEDRSLFPAYADNPARRQGSIRRGDGKAMHTWTPDETWRIELTWTREFGLALAYVDNALDTSQRAAMQRGL
jgi:hypothetical protein